MSMAMPTVLSQLWDCHQCLLQRRAARPQHMSSLLLPFPCLLRVVTASLHWGQFVQSQRYTQTLTFWVWLLLTIDDCTLCLTFSFLGNSFFMEVNLFDQRLLLLLFGLFSTEWVNSNSNDLSCVWAGATSLHHLPAVGRAACGVEELRSRPEGSWLQKHGSRTGHSFFTPKFPYFGCHGGFIQSSRSLIQATTAHVGSIIYTSQPRVSKLQHTLTYPACCVCSYFPQESDGNG